MALCGYKTSLCFTVISVWGIFQLLIMGFMFYIESPAFLEDLPIERSNLLTKDQFVAAMHAGYLNNAWNCLIATCLYIVSLGFAGWQFFLNQKTTYAV